MRAFAGLLALLVLGPASAAFTPAEENGRRIYHEGLTASGRPVEGVVGMAGSVMPGRAVACANCHGEDGLGRAEAGVLPPPIAWAELSKPSGHAHDNGRIHPPFDERGVGRAIVLGVDPAGNRLEPAMPRFRLHDDDLRDLIAYLKVLDRDGDPGVDEGVLRVGTVLPEAGPAAQPAAALRRAVEAVFAEASRDGVFGRRLELVVRGHGSAPGAAESAARELLDGGRVFALVAPFALGEEAALASLAEQKRVPVIGPFSPRMPPGVPGRYTFQLFSGASELAQVLAAFAASRDETARAPLLVLHDEASGPAAGAAMARCRRLGCPLVESHRYADAAPDSAPALQAARSAGAVLFLGPPGDLERFAASLEPSGARPLLLAAGADGARVAGRLPKAFDDRFFLAFPALPPAPDEAFGRFAARHGLAPGHALPAFNGYVAASLLVDALRRTGRAPRRERLVEALEATSGYRAGLPIALRYGPQRRIGAMGGHVVAAGAAGFRAASGWIALD